MSRPGLASLFGTLTASRSRRAMLVVALSAFLLGVFAGGTDVVLPLWVTSELGGNAGDWARLRSLRFMGVLLGVIVLGALSDRLGQRRLGVLGLVGAAAMTLLMVAGFRFALWLAMPFFGAFVSTGFLNLNSLTQMVSHRRQGLANAIYRSAMAAAGIGAPVLATWLAARWSGYRPVLGLLAALVLASGGVLWFFPLAEPAPAFSTWRQEWRLLWSGYRAALRERPLMRWIQVSALWWHTLSGVAAFAAIRCTRELGMSDRQFGLLSTAAASGAFLATAASGLFLDRLRLRVLCGLTGGAAGACSLAMGLGDSRCLTSIAILIYTLTITLWLCPASMWVSRSAGASSQSAAFTVHKVVTALYGVGAMALLGLLERQVGMRLVFLGCGVFGVTGALLCFVLPEPPCRPGVSSQGPPGPAA